MEVTAQVYCPGRQPELRRLARDSSHFLPQAEYQCWGQHPPQVSLTGQWAVFLLAEVKELVMQGVPWHQRAA